MEHRKQISAIVGAASLLLAFAANSADDVKIYPGANCQPHAGVAADNINTFTDLIRNGDAATRFVICPIVRDRVKNTNGVKAARVRVRSDGVNTLTCGLDAWSPFGVLTESNSDSTTSATAVNLDLDIDSSTKGGHYVIFCSLPPGTDVFSYRVVEFP